MRTLLPVFLLAFLTCSPLSAADHAIRVATFNIAMGLESEGDMATALESGADQRLRQLAEVLQTVRPDIVLLNEFDFDPATDAAGLLNSNYLGPDRNTAEPIEYPYHYRAPVNTGVGSGLDLDGDGQTDGPGDSWGFGHFPGQYGMLVLSRFPLVTKKSRTFQYFRWSDMPDARRPVNPGGSAFHPDGVWPLLRLSSKSHWDLVFDIGGEEFHLLAHHPTPPVFDGPEDRNGARNFDEIRFWRDYTAPKPVDYMTDDRGMAGGIPAGARFVIAGDFNADPHDGDSVTGAIDQLLSAPWIDAGCMPLSIGAVEASLKQGGVNTEHSGNPAADTSDFNDRHVGNLRLDYVLPASGLEVLGCGVYWPPEGEHGHSSIGFSDHRLVWLDIRL